MLDICVVLFNFYLTNWLFLLHPGDMIDQDHTLYLIREIKSIN